MAELNLDTDLLIEKDISTTKIKPFYITANFQEITPY